MAQLLVNVLPVNNLAAGATVSIPHLLESNGVGVSPTLVFPDRPSTIRVASVDATSVTFLNGGAATTSANFRCERGWQPEVDAFAVTPLLYAGAGNAVGGSGYFRAATLLSQIPGLTTGDLPLSVTIPPNSFRPGSCVRMRIAGTITVAVAPTNFNVTLHANAAKTAIFGAATTNNLPISGVAGHIISLDVEGSISSTGTSTLSSAEGSYVQAGGADFSVTSAPAAGGVFDATVVNTITPSITFGTPNGGTFFDLRYLVIDIAF